MMEDLIRNWKFQSAFIFLFGIIVFIGFNIHYRIDEVSYKNNYDTMNSVVYIEGKVQNSREPRIGSGFVISDNMIMTNKHVVNSTDYIEVEFNTGEVVIANTIFVTENVGDFAILRFNPENLKETNLQPLEIDCEYNFNRGDEIKVMGSPRGKLKFTETRGYVGSDNLFKRENEGPESGFSLQKDFHRDGLVVLDITAATGSSGGPVLHDDKVIGVLTRYLSDSVGGTLPLFLAQEMKPYCDLIQ